MRKFLFPFIITITSGGVALADDPTPAPPPDAPPPPEEKKPEEAKPEEKKPEEKKPEPPPAKLEPTVTTPTSGSAPVFDNMSATSSSGGGVEESGGKKPVHIAVELTGSGGKLGDPYIVYQGWTLENGATKGTRLEGQLGGILLAYELTAMSNTRACADGCVTGDFGSTTFQALELGYRFRLSMIGPVRPFLSASIGGVLGNSGDWSKTSGSSKGGVARAAGGVEIPFAKKFFATGMLSYRLIITNNPYRDPNLASTSKVLVDMADEPNGNFAQDAHVIGVNLGVGVSL